VYHKSLFSKFNVGIKKDGVLGVALNIVSLLCRKQAGLRTPPAYTIGIYILIIRKPVYRWSKRISLNAMYQNFRQQIECLVVLVDLG
jgi:hypothetical protein